MWLRRYATTETNTWSGGAGPAAAAASVMSTPKTLHERAEADAQRGRDPQRVRAAPRHEGEGRGGAGHAEPGACS